MLGASPGLTVSRIALGCGNFGGVGSAPEFFGRGLTEDEAFALMDAAWAAGIDWFDTADAYGGGRSERAIGHWMAAGGVRPRLTTKTYNPVEGPFSGGRAVIELAEIEAARARIADAVVRTPLVRLHVADAPAEIYLKLENLQPINSFKIRGGDQRGEAGAGRSMGQGPGHRQRGEHGAGRRVDGARARRPGHDRGARPRAGGQDRRDRAAGRPGPEDHLRRMVERHRGRPPRRG